MAVWQRRPDSFSGFAARERPASLLLFFAFSALLAPGQTAGSPTDQQCSTYQQQAQLKQTNCVVLCGTQFATSGTGFGGALMSDCQAACQNQFLDDLSAGCQQGCQTLCDASSPTSPTSSGTTPASPSGNVPVVLVPKPGDVVVTSVLAVGYSNFYCLTSKATTLDDMNQTTTANLYLNGAYNGNYTFDFTGKSTYLLKGGLSVTNATANYAIYGLKQTSFNGTRGCYFSLGDAWEETNGLINNTPITYITTTNVTGGLPPSGVTCPPHLYPAQTNGAPSYVWSVPFQAILTFFSTYIPPPPPATG